MHVKSFLAFLFLFLIITQYSALIHAGLVDNILKNTGILGVPLRFPMTNPSALNNYIIYYNDTSSQIMFYDVRDLSIKYTYTLTGVLTSSAVYGNYYVAGTDRGEIIVLDTENVKNIFRWVNAYFGTVSKVKFIDQNRIVALFGSGKLVVYDISTGKWKVYMPTDLAGMSGGVEEYGALYPIDFETVKPGVLLVQKPYYNYMKLIVFLEEKINQTEAKPLKNYRVWVELSGLILSGKTDSKGEVEFGLPESANWTINIYVESREYPGFAYKYTYRFDKVSCGEVKVVVIDYGVKGELTIPPEENGYILSLYKVDGVDLVHLKSVTLKSGEEIITMQDIGNGIYLLTQKGNLINMRIYDYNMNVVSYGWQIVGSSSVCSVYSNGNIVVGFRDGHVFFYRVYGEQIKALSGYVVKAVPVYVGVYKNYYLVIDSAGNIYGFYYDAVRKTIVPVYRSETMNGLNIMSNIREVYTTQDYVFMYGAPYSMLVYGLDKALERGIDVKDYMLYTVAIQVATPDGVLSGADVVLSGKIVDYEKKTDSNGYVVFNYVVSGNYTVHIYSPSILYRNITTWIYVDRDMNTTVKLPYNKFNVTIRILDAETNEPVYIDVPYSIQGENTTIQGTYRAGEQNITLILEPGDYQLSVEGITAYKPASVLFRVPDNLSVVLVLKRVNYTIGINIMDKEDKKKVNGTFTVVLKDIFGRVQKENITGSQALFKVDYIGLAYVEVVPLNQTARIYRSLNTTINIVGVGSYTVYLERQRYNVTFKIIDKQGRTLAKNIILEINGEKYSVKTGEITLELDAGTYSIKVYGNIYKDLTKTINIYGNGTIKLYINRKYDLMKLLVKDMFGRIMTDVPVEIRGIDNSYSVIMRTSEDGKVVLPLPYGTYIVEIGDGDIYEKTTIQVTIPMSEEQVISVKYTIKGILLSLWIWIVVAVSMIVLIIFMYRYGAKKLKEKFLTPEW